MPSSGNIVGCKNCSITEAWLALSGLPAPMDVARPYNLFNTIKTHVQTQSKNNFRSMLRPVSTPVADLHHQQNPVPSRPPFWNGEVRWHTDLAKENIVRAGHQFLAFHALFDTQHPYASYTKNFEPDLAKALQSVEKTEGFDVVQMVMKYVDNIRLPIQNNTPQGGGTLKLDEYLNMGVVYKGHAQTVLSSQFCFDFQSQNDKQRTLSLKAFIQPERALPCVRIVVETTGLQHLTVHNKFNAKHILQQTQKLKAEIKQVFFDFLTAETKDNILEVQYDEAKF